MIENPWPQQLAGRVVYQHHTIFEPELRFRHFHRLARFARESIVSNSLLQYLSESGPRQRSLAFLFDLMHASRGDRRTLSALAHGCHSLRSDLPLFIHIGAVSCDVVVAPDELMGKLHGQYLDQFVSLAVGAVVTLDKSYLPVAAPLSQEGQLFATLLTHEMPSKADELLFLAAKALISQWWRLEAEVIALSNQLTALGATIAEQFARDVCSHFPTQSFHEADEGSGALLVPPTPFCRDLALAWRPVGDRVEHTLNSAVNHCTKLEDLKMFGVENAGD